MRRSAGLVVLLVALATAAGVEVGRDARARASARNPLMRRPHPCEKRSCYPATGNLLIGREDKLTASSTCGMRQQERYCIVSHLEDRKKCFWCDSRPQFENDLARNHRIAHVVYRYHPGTRTRSWWQSSNGVENVTVQLDLEAEFHFTHLVVVFKTFRPAAMLVERSFDFGKTWRVYRYFAHDCDESFPGVSKTTPQTLADVVCETRYSAVNPSSDGEIIFRVLTPNVKVENPYSQEVQNLLKMTNLRVNFTKLHTLGDNLLDDRAEIKEKYYYAITDMTVRGSCSCYGHASRCLPLPGVESKTDMVHGRCECTHNTKGLNCELCEDFYNDLPWKPAIGKVSNACQRCSCNNHATSCRFDPAVYELTGKVSGGVCDDCAHNTMGRNCEFCKPYFYRDPELDVQDPEACKPCDCDPRGSIDDAVCDAVTDLANGLEAGRCRCRVNVEGRRCDSCKNGFWNFDEADPEGCKACTCNALGTVDDRGCDARTGECTCKRNVVGRDCNRCLPDYWGMSESEDGCKRCDCDVGGSLDAHCDDETGQCRCRPGVQGRRCEQPAPNHFAPSLDSMLYEAEHAGCNLGPDDNSISSNCQPTVREPFREGREDSWTGPGFMKVYEGDSLSFTVDDVRKSMDYDVVVRYESQAPGDWRVATVVVERPDLPPDPDSPCANAKPEDDKRPVEFPHYERSVVALPNVCLEEGKIYRVTVNFERRRPEVPDPRASLLIDSIVLVPKLTSETFFGNDTAETLKWRRNYQTAGCDDPALYGVNVEIPAVCRDFRTSVGFLVFNGATSCECDPTGSVSYKCGEYGGRCPCKPYVVGRRCNKCAPGTYGFGPEGCKACDCSNIGSLDNFCDAGSGQCRCKANTYGRKCDECQPGYWNFPNCQRCECNGHADVCDSRTGACVDCRDSTVGHRCERCADGHYGDPRLGRDIPCRACPCPGSAEAGHSFAPRCNLDPFTNDVYCECLEGYAGPRCDVCGDNYFGNPEVPGGSCRKCDCGKNVDLSTPGNCDARTGKCLKCLYDTAGDQCNTCREGFYGNATEQTCRECDCEILGTDLQTGSCDGSSGQCSCFPNVIGVRCDECVENHWKIASGEGCVPCDCDSVGSTKTQCNPFEGNCECKQGFGSRRCDQCQTDYWGDPNIECFSCECDEEGSAQTQCRHDTGACVCKPGMGGYKCDVCARGFFGESCSACGECFDNWDVIVTGLRNQTTEAVSKAGKIQTVGATGAYTRDFEEMESHLKTIRNVVDDTELGNKRIVEFDQSVIEAEKNFNESASIVENLNRALTDVVANSNLANYSLSDLRANYEKLLDKIKELDDDATKLQEANLEGALNLTRIAKQRAIAAAENAEAAQIVMGDTERNIKSTEQLLEREYQNFNNTQKENDKNLSNLQEALSDLESQIPELNDKMCGSTGDPCGLCGGAGCNKCGGFSCDKGASTKADRAYEYANKTDALVRDYNSRADDLLRAITLAKQNTVAAHEASEEAYEAAIAAKNKTDETSQKIASLSRDLKYFLANSGKTPTDVRLLADIIMNMKIVQEDSAVKALAAELNMTASQITDIDKIIIETKQHLESAKDLKERASNAKENALARLEKAKEIKGAIDEAADAQALAREAIDKATSNIEAVKKLPPIERHLNQTNEYSFLASRQIDDLSMRLKNLEKKVLINEQNGKEIKDETENIVIKAENAQLQARELRQNYLLANSSLTDKIGKSADSRERAQNLLKRATHLAGDAQAQLKQLHTMEDLYNNHTTKLNALDDQIKKLHEEVKHYSDIISERSEYYRQNC